MPYQNLTSHTEAELEIKKSRFLAFVRPTTSRDAAHAMISNLKAAYPDARHVCAAAVFGDPANATEVLLDDDGEPSGTAAKPMFSALQGREVGSVCAVVVRYFGGVKLGAGGLARAYSKAVLMALDTGEFADYVEERVCTLAADFSLESQLRYLTESIGGEVLGAHYTNQVGLTIKLTEVQHTALSALLEPHHADLSDWDHAEPA